MEAETCKKELVIEIPVDVLRKESENVTAQYQRTARIPGFRRGHAPATLVRHHFRDAIRKQVVQSLLPKFFERAVKEQKLAVVGEPRFEDLKFDDEQPLTCKAMFEVLPEFELGDYKNLEAEEDPGTVTEADVDQALEELRQGAATYEVVEDRPADDDDYVLVSYQGRDVKEPGAPPLEARDAVVPLGGKGTVAAFSANLRGAKSGEVREFDVPYPDDYPQKSLAGKTFRYRVEVQSIKKKVVPAVDDELAKSVSESETLADLRVKLRAELETRRRHQVEKVTMSKLLEQLVNRGQFPVPQALVEAQLDRKIENIVTRLVAQRIDPRSTEIDWRKLREESRPEAEKEVRGSLILERVAEAEGIEVTEEEVDELVRATAEERHEPPAALKTRLTREGTLDRIRVSRRSQKALEFIYRNAKIIRKSEGTSSAG
ncbi:MAG: trigger factor [Acidobacteriia bacterium]|nr:trigger factor [Terriglobia bacterium]